MRRSSGRVLGVVNGYYTSCFYCKLDKREKKGASGFLAGGGWELEIGVTALRCRKSCRAKNWMARDRIQGWDIIIDLGKSRGSQMLQGIDRFSHTVILAVHTWRSKGVLPECYDSIMPTRMPSLK